MDVAALGRAKLNSSPSPAIILKPSGTFIDASDDSRSSQSADRHSSAEGCGVTSASSFAGTGARAVVVAAECLVVDDFLKT